MMNPNIDIIGLPLAAAFGMRFNAVGFDIDGNRNPQHQPFLEKGARS